MSNNYCENKSNKPVITRYYPSKNYMVQMVESLASVDYPNENHIYVIESTGDKYIFYNGAFTKFEATALEPLVVTFNAIYTSSGTSVYQYYYSDYVTYDKTYDEVKQAVEEGRPVYLKSYNNIYVMSVEIDNNQIIFSDNSARRFENNTQFETYSFVLVMPKIGTYGTSTRVVLKVHNLVPDTALSSTSTKPVQNKVVKQAIDAISTFYPVLVTTGNNYLTWSVSNYTHGTCRTHIEVNGTLCPIFIVKIGSVEYEILQIEKGNGQLHVYAYFRLIRDGNQNITDIQYIKFQLNLQSISEIQANTTIYDRQDGGILRAYYWDRTTSEYRWFGIVNSSYKWAIGYHEENHFSLYAQVSADQFIQVTNVGSSAITLNSKFYEVQAIQF